MSSILRNLANFAASLLMFSCMSVAIAQQGDGAIGSVATPTGQTYRQPKTIPSHLSRITFYRPVKSVGDGVIGIKINDHYHTSLQVGTYSDLCVQKTERAQVTSRLVQTGVSVKEQVDASAQLSLQGGQETYVRVIDLGNGRSTIRVVDAQEAKFELDQTNRQIHAVSRVPNAVTCEAKAPAQRVETITLAADTLFAFGKSDKDAISPDGRQSMDQLITRMQKKYGSFEAVEIQIIGHADPLGNEASNKRLSESRAKTIKDYMVDGGIAAEKITSEGRGASSPLVTNCARVATPESIACNKPNRRVVIGVSIQTR
jgi:OOP family OmpA-OmpF porin